MILATVQSRCRSSGAGSSTSTFRCSRIPIGRCSRNACWAAAIDFARSIAIGATTPGNSTVLRTGIMIRASPGIGTGPVSVGLRSSLVGDMAVLEQICLEQISLQTNFASNRFCQAQDNASIRGEAADGVTPYRQYDA